MFTGIVQARGWVAHRSERGGDVQLSIHAGGLGKVDPRLLAAGESVAVNGVCLTVVGFDGEHFIADVSRETMAVTTLGTCVAGTAVNLEPALRAGDPLGGHLVSGHVDGIVTVIAVHAEARSLRVMLQAPPALGRYIAPKGSVALDGVSLTINEVAEQQFGVNLVPHTTAVTTFAAIEAGQRFNLEVDQIARYLERLLALRAG